MNFKEHLKDRYIITTKQIFTVLLSLPLLCTSIASTVIFNYRNDDTGTTLSILSSLLFLGIIIFVFDKISRLKNDI